MNESLEHYGVKGMKWGIRKDPVKAFNKAGKKLAKLDKRYKEHMSDAEYYSYNAREPSSDAGPGYRRGIAVNAVKAQRSHDKAAKYAARAARWQQSMSKKISKISMSSIEKNKLNQEYVKLGQAYSQELYQDITYRQLVDLYVLRRDRGHL